MYVRLFVVAMCLMLISWDCSSLTEKIVAVLPRMKCPHRLEPHQIQGLDFIHIYPVIQVGTMARARTHTLTHTHMHTHMHACMAGWVGVVMFYLVDALLHSSLPIILVCGIIFATSS